MQSNRRCVNKSMRYSDVIQVDLRKEAEAPKTFEELLTGVNDLGQEGVIRPWSLLLVDDAKTFVLNSKLYENILQHSTHPRLIVLVCGSPAEPDLQGKRFTVPRVFEQVRERSRIILLTSETGCEWASGEHVPSGLLRWDGDPDGVETVAMLTDVFSAEEIFEKVFASTNESSNTLWSVGTKQVWFGRLPATATADAFHKTGNGLVGDDGKAALIRKSDEFRIPKELNGDEVEVDILYGGPGTLLDDYSSLKKQIVSMKRKFGLAGQKGSIARVARFPEDQLSALNDVIAQIEKINANVLSMMESVDASDGLDVEERKRLETVGVQWQRQDEQRDRFLDADTKLNDKIVDGIREAIAGGHSVAPLIVQLDDVIEKVRPKDPAELVQTFAEYSFAELLEKMKASIPLVPRGPIMKFGKLVASVIEPAWSRLLIAFLFVWVTLTAGLEAIDDNGNSGFGLLPQNIRNKISDLIVYSIFFVIAIAIIVAGVIFVRADNAISRWGKKTKVSEVEKAIDRQKGFVESTALNEWVLSYIRRTTVENLKHLRETLQLLATSLKGQLIDKHEFWSSSDLSRSYPNPQVRKDLNNVAAAGTFMQMDRVEKILRTDVSTIIDEVLALRVHEFKGKNAAKVPQEIVAEVDLRVSKFIPDVIEKGPLTSTLALSKKSIDLREELTTNYWEKIALVGTSAQETVLLDAKSSFVQFVSSDEILHLDKQNGGDILIRFAPRPSLDHIVTSGKTSGINVESITFTAKTSCAGILRLVGFKDAFFKYESDATQSEPDSPSSFSPDFQ